MGKTLAIVQHGNQPVFMVDKGVVGLMDHDGRIRAGRLAHALFVHLHDQDDGLGV